jgi:hypothetical protein
MTTTAKTHSSNPLKTTLGLAKDGVSLAKPAVSAGFGIAHACVDTGFWIMPKQFILWKSPVELAHGIAHQSLHVSSFLAQSSLEATDTLLDLAGAQHGSTLRLLKEYVDSQSHTNGHDT